MSLTFHTFTGFIEYCNKITISREYCTCVIKVYILLTLALYTHFESRKLLELDNLIYRSVALISKLCAYFKHQLRYYLGHVYYLQKRKMNRIYTKQIEGRDNFVCIDIQVLICAQDLPVFSINFFHQSQHNSIISHHPLVCQQLENFVHNLT